MSIIALTGLQLFYQFFLSAGMPAETPIDNTWWSGLTDEWRTALLINQNLQTHHADIFRIQEEYINRLNDAHEPDYSEMNHGLRDLHAARTFSLSLDNLYARAQRTGHVLHPSDSINLQTLESLDTLYLVNGPSDLSPLRKFKHLKVLILNFCGTGNTTNSQPLNLEPLRHLQELKILHCASNRISSLYPLRNLLNLEELKLDNSNLTGLGALKNLVNLRKLSVGLKNGHANIVSHLSQLEELSIDGCVRIPNLSRLKKLRALSIAENELAIVQAAYRTKDISFLKSLSALEFLDLGMTSYTGGLSVLYELPNLRAVTLPSVSSTEVALLQTVRKDCIVINAFQFER